MKPFKTIAIAALAASVAVPALTASHTAFAQDSAANSDGGQFTQETAGKRFAHMGERGGFGRGQGPRGGRQQAERLFERFDVDGDGVITAEEIAEVQSKDFAEADTDGNGNISLEEFKAGFMTRSNDRMVRAFQMLDRDGDGVVTQEEADTAANRIFNRLDRDGNDVVERVRGQRGQGQGQGGQAGQGQRAEGENRQERGPRGMGRGRGGPQKMFMTVFDTNNDGTVTRDDFDTRRSELFALADTNGSGSFTLQDFGPLWMAINEDRIVTMFQRADADGNLGISPDEHGKRSAQMLERSDRNGDGVITKADFKRGKKGKRGEGRQRG